MAYGLITEIAEEGYDREYVDRIFAQAYQNLSDLAGRDIPDPFCEPCTGQYQLLDELRSYGHRDLAQPFLRFIRAEFKKAFVPTMRLLTELCHRRISTPGRR